jgi:HSP20 family molecular chaperone IbpA
MFYLRDGFGNELNWLDGFDNFMQQGFTKGFMASDLTEDEKEYKLTIDVPGVDKRILIFPLTTKI